MITTVVQVTNNSLSKDDWNTMYYKLHFLIKKYAYKIEYNAEAEQNKSAFWICDINDGMVEELVDDIRNYKPNQVSIKITLGKTRSI